ncbi:hypothetical protein WJX72_001032 [[Myrmecia] bisecta]|uniref:Uncharacterized protein n=1 Tax=[Myrmecia] bisecta TaxID=41462 RepID=A0AAW1QE65_9CHLO
MPSVSRISEAAEASGALKKVNQAVQSYQIARTDFVNAVQNALKQQDGGVSLEGLMQGNILALLCCPLLQDPTAGIQIQALAALGKLAAANEAVASSISSCGILESVVSSLSHESAPIRVAAHSALQAIASSSPENAQAVLASGAMPALQAHLEAFEPAVKEAAVRTLNIFVDSSADMAEQVLQQDAVSSLINNARSVDAAPGLQAAIAITLGNACAWSPSLTAKVVDAGAIPVLCTLLQGRAVPATLKAAALTCLSQVAQHSEALAEEVASYGVMPAALNALTDAKSVVVRQSAASLVQQVAHRSAQLAQVVAIDGGAACIVRGLELDMDRPAALSCVLAMGHIAGFQDTLARTVVEAGGCKALVQALQSPHPQVAAAAAWTVLQLAQGPDTAGPLAEQGALGTLLDLYQSAKDRNFKAKVKAALKQVIHQCKQLSALHPLVSASTPRELVRHVLYEFAQVLPTAVEERRAFITCGAFMQMQRLDCSEDARAQQHRDTINSLYPQAVVEYYGHQN